MIHDKNEDEDDKNLFIVNETFTLKSLFEFVLITLLITNSLKHRDN